MKIVTTPTRPRGVVGVIYGPEGIGKSTLASSLETPLFLDAEKGAHGLKVAKVDEEITFVNLSKIIQELIRDHQGYRTLVLDTVDAIETRLLAEFCQEKNIKSIEDIPYGKGYAMYAEKFVVFLDKCRALAESGMNVVFVAHAEIRKFEMPDERGSYDRWQLKLSKQTMPKLKECADFIIFVNYKTNIVQADKKAGETKAHATGGRRWCYTSHTTSFDAKCRCFIRLPEECALDDMQKSFSPALQAATEPAAPAPRPDTPPAPEAPVAPSTAPKTASVPERPLVRQLYENAAAYGVTVEQLFGKYNVKHTARYGQVDTPEEWADDFIKWILAGIAAGKIVIK